MPYRTWKSDFEGFGLVLLEANACGTPVISTHESGAEEPVAHNENGVLIPPENVAVLSQAVRTLLSDTPQWKALADGAYRRAQKMTWRRSANLLLDVYTDALGKRLVQT
jgi:glycosyltransferase involved in cell wall biosynthesis